MAISLPEFATLFLRHGANVILYPGAFEPHPRTLHAPSKWGLHYEDLILTTEDKVKIHAYLLQTESNKQNLCSPKLCGNLRPVIIMFHGNCDNIGFTVPLAKKFLREMHCNVLMLSPRGYGRSEGKPSTRGFRRDADAALDYILSHPELSKSQIILYGQSMGGAMAIDLAGRKSEKITALIIENTFTSIRRLIPDVMPFCSPLAPFFRQWNSKRTLEKLPFSVSILMLSGEKDEVIPSAHMHQLWKAAHGPRRCSSWLSKLKIVYRKEPVDEKPSSTIPDSETSERNSEFKSFQNGKHNNTCDTTGYWQAIQEFLKTLPSR